MGRNAGSRDAKLKRFRLDRDLPGLGRIRCSTGARTMTEHRRALVLFDKLLREGRLDLIRALVEDRVSWAELHDCRHIAAQLLDDAGRPLTSIQATLGHSSPSQTAKYARKRLRREDSQALAEALGPLLKVS